jgi:hypothetical protein
VKIDAIVVDFDAVLIDSRDHKTSGPDHGTHVEEARVNGREGNAIRLDVLAEASELIGGKGFSIWRRRLARTDLSTS